MPPLIRHAQIVHATRLLNMLYKPFEIAAELEVSADTILRSYIPAGLPHLRDGRGTIWIHGPACATWIRENARSRRARQPLGENEGYCLGCRHIVQMNGAVRVRQRPRIRILQWDCPSCGKTVNRIQTLKKGSGL